MEELMKAMGVENSYFKTTTELTSSEQVKALCDGKIDAFGYSVGFPNGAMEQAATCAAKASPINLTGAPVQGLISGADYYAQAVIPKGTYSNQKKDATTFGVKATVVTSADVSDARIGGPSSSPRTSGRIPKGSRAPTNFLLVKPTREYAPSIWRIASINRSINIPR